MARRRAGSLSSLRELNRLKVLEVVRERGTVSRAEIAVVTGLARSTVSTALTMRQPDSARTPTRCSARARWSMSSSNARSITVTSRSQPARPRGGPVMVDLVTYPVRVVGSRIEVEIGGET